MYTTKKEAQAFNAQFFDMLDDPGQAKSAAAGVTEWTRTTIREDSFSRKISPQEKVTADMIDRQVHTDKPVIIIDKEPNQPPARSVPYGGLPVNHYLRGGKYQVTPARIVSPNFTKDMSELRTYTVDIRQVMADNAIKDILAEEDSRYIQAWNAVLGGSAGSTCYMTGAIQWQQLSGGIDRSTHKASRKIMPATKYRLEATTALVNNLTIRDFESWGRDEYGGDGSEDLLVNGWTKKRWDNLDWIITIKQDLVADSTVYYFADPKFIGKTYMFEEPTMYVERKFWMLSFFLWEEIGSTIGHAAGGVRVDYV